MPRFALRWSLVRKVLRFCRFLPACPFKQEPAEQASNDTTSSKFTLSSPVCTRFARELEMQRCEHVSLLKKNKRTSTQQTPISPFQAGWTAQQLENLFLWFEAGSCAPRRGEGSGGARPHRTNSTYSPIRHRALKPLPHPCSVRHAGVPYVVFGQAARLGAHHGADFRCGSTRSKPRLSRTKQQRKRAAIRPRRQRSLNPHPSIRPPIRPAGLATTSVGVDAERRIRVLSAAAARDPGAVPQARKALSEQQEHKALWCGLLWWLRRRSGCRRSWRCGSGPHCGAHLISSLFHPRSPLAQPLCACMLRVPCRRLWRWAKEEMLTVSRDEAREIVGGGGAMPPHLQGARHGGYSPTTIATEDHFHQHALKTPLPLLWMHLLCWMPLAAIRHGPLSTGEC